MKKILQLIILIAVLPVVSKAQSKDDEMETDRPSNTLTPEIVKKGRIQVEAGVRREHDVDEGMRHDTYFYPTALVKYGVSKKLEVRVTVEEEVDYDYVPDKQRSAVGVEPIKLGLKYNLFDEKGALPKTSVMARASIPKAASEDFKGDFVAPWFRLLMQNKLTDKLELSYNVGAQWKDDDVHGKLFYSITPQLELSEKLKVFAEFYSKVSKENPASTGADGGFLFKVNKNLQLDISAGAGLSKAENDNFVELGVSFRFPK